MLDSDKTANTCHVPLLTHELKQVGQVEHQYTSFKPLLRVVMLEKTLKHVYKNEVHKADPATPRSKDKS